MQNIVLQEVSDSTLQQTPFIILILIKVFREFHAFFNCLQLVCNQYGLPLLTLFKNYAVSYVTFIEQIHYITHFTIENNLDTEVSYAEVFICKRLTTRENL